MTFSHTKVKVLALAVLLASGAWAQADSAPTPTPPLQRMVVWAPRAVLSLEVADTYAERERGLMERRTLPPDTGMLFVFAHDGLVKFWMKDTLVPLDMVFIGADGRVRSIAANVPTVSPTLTDVFIPRERGRAQYVIELAAGEAAKAGIVPGVRLLAPRRSSP